jgi:hypothetical protein
MGMLENVLGCKEIIFPQEMVSGLVQYLKNIKSGNLSHVLVCNVHHMNEPLVAYINLN